MWCGCVLTRLEAMRRRCARRPISGLFSKPFQNPLIPPSFTNVSREEHRFPSWRLGFTMTETFKFSCFFVLLVFFSLSNVHGLKVPFEQRAPRGASMTSPRSGSRYTFGSNQRETLVNVRDFRVNIFFMHKYLC